MVAKSLTKKESCPFWSEDSMKCRVCDGGLFIPLDDHIDIYCKTPNYPQCLQYGLHSEKQLEILNKARRETENRRKYMRIYATYKVTLANLSQANKIVSDFSTVAKTLDVSKGGMRLATDTPLIHDTVIQFSFDDSFPATLQKGTGQVTWCNKQIDESGYQAGISFRDEHIAEAMSQHLA